MAPAFFIFSICRHTYSKLHPRFPPGHFISQKTFSLL